MGKELQDEEFLKIAFYDFGKYLILPSNIYRQARRELYETCSENQSFYICIYNGRVNIEDQVSQKWAKSGCGA